MLACPHHSGRDAGCAVSARLPLLAGEAGEQPARAGCSPVRLATLVTLTGVRRLNRDPGGATSCRLSAASAGTPRE